MIKAKNIRRMDMFSAGPVFKMKISYKNGTSEDMSFFTFTDEGKEKLEGLKEFIKVNNLEERCFLIKA